MAETVAIGNDLLRVEINSAGAEMTSIKKNGTERLWCGDPNVWDGHAPILFPICGGLRSGSFLYNGREYFPEKHGFAANRVFTPEIIGEDRAVFLLKSDEGTKKVYPFDFEFRAAYTLNENQIAIDYEVKNTGTVDMYYSVGAHEAYACPGGLENYKIIFERSENLESNLVEDGILSHKTVCIAKGTNTLKLKNEYFEVDALIFCGLKSRRLTLADNADNVVAKIDFNGSDYLLVWTIPGAEFICIEPWCGLPDYTDSDRNICTKPGIIKLMPGAAEVRRHTITF